MFGGRSKPPREVRAVIKEIENGKPIIPKQSQPASVEQDGLEVCINDYDREGFAKTAQFGVILNRTLAWAGWRVQERCKVLIPIFDDTPCFGRTFDLFYNAHLTGVLYLYAKPGFEFSGLSLRLEIEHVRYFEHGDLHGILRGLTILLSEKGEDLTRREIEVDRCLTRTLWELVRSPDQLHTLEFVTESPITPLFEQLFQASPAA